MSFQGYGPVSIYLTPYNLFAICRLKQIKPYANVILFAEVNAH